jgi:hypothetical protein
MRQPPAMPARWLRCLPAPGRAGWLHRAPPTRPRCMPSCILHGAAAWLPGLAPVQRQAQAAAVLRLRQHLCACCAQGVAESARVAPAGTTASIAVMGRSCAACGDYCEEYEFSNNQWSKGAGASRCRDCVTSSVAGCTYECRAYSCSQTFNSTASRDQHERAVHPFCPQCDRGPFCDENACNQHSKLYHLLSHGLAVLPAA